MAFGLMIVYIAVLLMRPQEWYEPLKGYEIINVIAIMTILATFVTEQRGTEPVLTVLSRNKYARFMWGILMAIVLSEITKFHVGSIVEALQSFGKVAIFFFLCMVLLNTPERLRKVMAVVVISAVLLSIHGIIQYRTGYGFGHIEAMGVEEMGDLRLTGSGMFSDPNDFAMLFVLAAPFAFYFLRLTGFAMTKAMIICSFPAMMFVLYNTQSRGGLFGFCIGLTAYAWLSLNRLLPRVLLISLLLGGAMLFAPVRATGTVDVTGSGRIAEWGTANTIFRQSPIFGVGYERYLYHAGYRAAHNSYMTCYAELGVVGYFVWFSLSWLVLRGVIRIARMKKALPKSLAELSIALAASLAGYLASAVFLTKTYNPVLFLLVGMGIGLIRYVNRSGLVPPNLTEITGRDLRKAGMWAILSIPFFALIIKASSAMGGG